MLWLGQSKAVIGNTVKNTLTDPFFLTLHLCGIAFLTLLSCLPSYGLDEHTRFYREQGVALNFIFSCLAASFILIRNVSDDIRRGAGSVLMSRPVSPRTVIVSKWIGSAICLSILYFTHSISFLWTTKAAAKANIIEVTPLVLLATSCLIALIIAAVRNYLFGSGFTAFANCAIPVIISIIFSINYMMNSGEGFDISFWPAALSLFTALITFSVMLLPFAVIADAAFVLSAAAVLFAYGVVAKSIYLEFIPIELLSQGAEAILPNWQSYWMTDVTAITAPKVPEELLQKSEEIRSTWQSQEAFKRSFELIYQTIIRITCLAALYLPVAIFLFERQEIKGENG